MERRGAERAEAAEQKVRELAETTNQLTRAVIAAAIEVHEELGPGFLEHIYETAMEIELRSRGLGVQRQLSVPVYLRDHSIGESIIDLVIERTLVLELKAVEDLRPLHKAQVLSYLRAGGYDIGLLINFNVARLVDGVRRVIWTL